MIFRTGRDRRIPAGANVPGEHDTGATAVPARSLAAETLPEAAVRAQLERLLASERFRYSERLNRFLKFVVERQLAGCGGELKESVLAVEIFDRETSYDPRVDSVVRVEARRLRDKLERYYAEEGREDPVAITLPKGSYAPVFTLRVHAKPPAAPPPETAPVTAEVHPQTSLKLIALVAVVSVLATVLVTRLVSPRRAGSPPLRRLTSDPGLTFQPVLSNDGQLLAYASDRSGNGNLDIWVQQVAGGLPRRLTENPADDLEPSFSPDGTHITYRAEGEAGGVYLAPVLGGASTLLARGGYRPRFSPDGTRVAYWTGERSFWTAGIFVVPAAGGAPVPFQKEFRYAAYPVWSPDGRHIIFVGSKDPGGKDWDSNAEDWDWYAAPAAGGPAIRTSVAKIFSDQGIKPPRTGWSHRRIVPYHWAASGMVVFSARSGEQTNIWGVRIPADTWQAAAPAEQLTFGTGREDHPSMSSDGALVFSVLTGKADIWSLPLDANAIEPQGPEQRLTADAANYMRPVISRDGSRLAFLSNRNGNVDVWVRDLRTGADKALTSTREDETAVALSPDGARVAFGARTGVKDAIYAVPYTGGGTAQLCGDCGEPRVWLPGGTALLYQQVSPGGESLIASLDMSGHTAPLLKSTGQALFSPSISGDGRWMALIVRKPPSAHAVMVAPLRGGVPAPESEWMRVTEPGPWFDKPRWSADGNTIYYISDRDGFVCIWAQRLHPATRAPAGGPKPVAHFHGSRHTLRTVFGLDMSVAADKLVFNLGEDFGNIWLAPAGK